MAANKAIRLGPVAMSNAVADIFKFVSSNNFIMVGDYVSY
jgi:hypothetical protein